MLVMLGRLSFVCIMTAYRRANLLGVKFNPGFRRFRFFGFGTEVIGTFSFMLSAKYARGLNRVKSY